MINGNLSNSTSQGCSMRICLVIGHSVESPGAINKRYGVNEFEFNQALAHEIESNFVKYNVEDEIVVVYRETSYKNLPYEINEYHPDMIVSLHCNAYDEKTSGCETLYYEKSQKGKELAETMQSLLVSYIGNDNRGIKSRNEEQRGGHLLKNTHAPCIIVEPFFIDNDEELRNVKSMFENGKLSDAFCRCINAGVESLKE